MAVLAVAFVVLAAVPAALTDSEADAASITNVTTDGSGTSATLDGLSENTTWYLGNGAAISAGEDVTFNLNGYTLTIVAGAGKTLTVSSKLVFAEGGTVVIAAGATVAMSSNTLTVNAGVTLSVSGVLTGTDVDNSGTIQAVNGGNLNGAAIENDDTGVTTYLSDDSDMGNVTIAGTIQGPDNAYGANQMVTIGANTTMTSDAVMTISGKLFVPAGVTLTIEAGAALTFDTNAVFEIEGSVVVKDDETVAKITITEGAVLVYGTFTSGADMTLGSGSIIVEADGVMTVTETGSLEIGTAATSLIEVEASGTLSINGSLGAATIENDGTVVFDSEVASESATIVMGNGAVVDVKSIAMKTTEKLTVKDVEDGEDVNTIEIEAATEGTADGSAYILAVIEGLKITEKATLKTDSTTEYDHVLHISGSAEVSALYVPDDTNLEEPAGMGSTATVTLTGGAANTEQGVTVSEALTVGEGVTLDNKGQLIVSATVDGVEGTVTQTSETITVKTGGSIVLAAELSSEEGVSATKYKTGSTSSDTRYNYVTLDAALEAANAGTASALTVLGTQTLNSSATVPEDVTVTMTGATLSIGAAEKNNDVVLTVADGASVKGVPTEVTINGTIYAEDKTDIASDVRSKLSTSAAVYSEELDEKNKAVRDGWAKWTNLTTALNEASDGSVVKIMKDLTIGTNTTIPAGVTLDSNKNTITVEDGVTLTVNGTLFINT